MFLGGGAQAGEYGFLAQVAAVVAAGGQALSLERCGTCLYLVGKFRWKAVFLGGGAQAGEQAACLAKHPAGVGKDGTIALGIAVDLQQGKLAIAQEGYVPAQTDGIGNAWVAGNGCGANLLEIPPAASALLDAHAGGEASLATAEDALQIGAALCCGTHKHAILRHGAEPTGRADAKAGFSIVAAEDRRARMGEEHPPDEQPQPFRQSIPALFAHGDPALGEQALQRGSKLLGGNAGHAG